MKNIYVCFLREESEIIGILNKIKQQCLAMNNLGVPTGLIISRNDSVVLYEIADNEFVEKSKMAYSRFGSYDEQKNTFQSKLSSYVRLKQFLGFARQAVREHRPQSVYIRNIQPITIAVAAFIKFIARRGHKVYWEIPTYSPSREKGVRNLKSLYSKYMHRYISLYLTKNVAIAAEEGLEREGYIFTTNGVNVNSVKVKGSEVHESLNLVCVATFDHWHGYDRLIEGLNHYYAESKGKNKRIVHLHMVGNGNVQPLIDQVSKHQLGDCVTFHGVMRGQELDRIFDSMDIAIGNLGFHRVGVFADTSIKIREYCARGIPFITALNDSDFPQSFQFRKKVPADETAIDIGSVIEFYDQLMQGHPNFSQEMRRYAENHLTWEQKMKFIIESEPEHSAAAIASGRRVTNEL